MNLRKDNRIIVDLKKCQFAVFYYRNQYGTVQYNKPKPKTYFGKDISPIEKALFHPTYPDETLLERFHRRGVKPDVWTPELLLKLSANHCLIYIGEKAVSIYKKWCEMIYGHKS